MSEQTATRTITHGDYLKLLGLAALLDENLKQQLALKEAVAGIVGEKADEHGYYGHVDDWTYGFGPHNPAELLHNLYVEVEPAPDAD